MLPIYRYTLNTGPPLTVYRNTGTGTARTRSIFQSKFWVLASLYSYCLLFQLVFSIASSTCAREKNQAEPTTLASSGSPFRFRTSDGAFITRRGERGLSQCNQPSSPFFRAHGLKRPPLLCLLLFGRKNKKSARSDKKKSQASPENLNKPPLLPFLPPPHSVERERW